MTTTEQALKDIRDKQYSILENGEHYFHETETKVIQTESYNLGRDEVIKERIETYVAMRDKYAGIDDSMALAYDTVVNDLLNMQHKEAEMTNDNIREKYIKDNGVNGCPTCGGIKSLEYDYYASHVDAIQDLTRADERDRVIEDIKETLTRLYVNDIDVTDLYCAMIKELNSLKENK